MAERMGYDTSACRPIPPAVIRDMYSDGLADGDWGSITYGPFLPSTVAHVEGFYRWLRATPGCATAADNLPKALDYGRSVGLLVPAAETVRRVVGNDEVRRRTEPGSQARVALPPWAVETVEMAASGGFEGATLVEVQGTGRAALHR